MSATMSRVIGALVFFMLVFGSGFWLRSIGTPYNSVALTIHKLISLAATIVLGFTIYKINQASGLDRVKLIAVVITGVLLIGAIVSGGLTSINSMPRFMLRLHQVALSLASISSAVTLYLLLREK